MELPVPWTDYLSLVGLRCFAICQLPKTGIGTRALAAVVMYRRVSTGWRYDDVDDDEGRPTNKRGNSQWGAEKNYLSLHHHHRPRRRHERTCVV